MVSPAWQAFGGKGGGGDYMQKCDRREVFPSFRFAFLIFLSILLLFELVPKRMQRMSPLRLGRHKKRFPFLMRNQKLQQMHHKSVQTKYKYTTCLCIQYLTRVPRCFRWCQLSGNLSAIIQMKAYCDVERGYIFKCVDKALGRVSRSSR